MTVPFYRFYTVKNTQYECLYDANYTVYRTTYKTITIIGNAIENIFMDKYEII